MRNFKAKYEALDEETQKQMNDKLGGTLGKIVEVFSKRQEKLEKFGKMSHEERKKLKAKKLAAFRASSPEYEAQQ